MGTNSSVYSDHNGSSHDGVIMGGDSGGTPPVQDEDDTLQQQFHNSVRENIIFLLFFLTLICVSSAVVEFLTPNVRKRSPSVHRPSTHNFSAPARRKEPDDDDESVVKRICSWVCTVTLSISIGATLLLPISIVSNEVLLIHPTNSNLEWLNGMLIQGLWNLVFLFSNFGLFLLLPFAHLFIEAEGFSGKKRGVMSKVQETVVVLALIMSIMWGISVVTNSFFATRGTSLYFHINQLPFIYSVVSFGGVLVFTLITPLGLSRLFSLLSENFIFVPEFMRNLEHEHKIAELEYENLRNAQAAGAPSHGTIFQRKHKKTEDLDKEIDRMKAVVDRLESLRSTPPWKRNVLYPGLFICVLAVTGLTVFIVVINAFKIITGFRDISLELVAKETLPLGRSSLSFLGPCGAIFEIILVAYLISTCFIGLYSLPYVSGIRPLVNATPISHVIYNCAIALVLSSALPVFMRILGLTNFDLLGTYAGKIDWIENTLIVVIVNLLFSGLTCVCLISNVTSKISHEILRRLRVLFYTTD